MKALDAHVDMLRWVSGAFGQGYLRGLADANGVIVKHEIHQAEDWVARLFPKALDRSDTYAVSDEIADVLAQASATLPSFELHREDIPTPLGFVYFEDHQVLHDHKGSPLAVKAIGWASVSRIEEDGQMYRRVLLDSLRPGEEIDGIVTMLYTDPAHPNDHLADQWHEVRREMSEHGNPSPPLVPMLGPAWDVGDDFGEDGDEDNPLNIIRRLLGTFFRFVNEPWIDDRMMIPNRQAIKRARRARITPEVRVIQLRKAKQQTHKSDDPSELHYSHRFIVQAHWRNQWYPSQQRHAPRWIPSYVKGPEDRPLILRDKVFHVRR